MVEPRGAALENGGPGPTMHRPILSLARFLGVFLLFAAVTAVFFWEWMPHLSSALIGPPEDNMQDFWNTRYVAFAHDPTHFFFTNLIQFPEGTPLTYHSFAYPQVFAVAFISKIFGLSESSLMLQQNLSLLISFPLAATGAFYLVRHFTGEYAGASLGGFVFGFNPSHVEQVMHHAHVSQIEFIPFFVLAFLVSIRRKSVLWLLWSIILFALSALSCWYYLFYLAYFMVFHTVYVSIRDRSLPRGWQLITPIACVAAVVTALSPLLLPMVRAALSGASVYYKGSNIFVANVVAYVAFPPFHLLGRLTEGIYGQLRTLDTNDWEATVYLGLINVAVLAWLWGAGGPKQKKLLAYVLCGIVVFCIFASGDSLHVKRHIIMPMPDVLLSHLPFFANVRTPSRAIVFVYLFLAVGVGCAGALAWRSPPQHIRRWAVAAVAALIVLDFFPARRLPMTPLVCSPGLALIRADTDKGFGVLDLPSGSRADYDASNLYMFQQTCHGRPIAQGNTSRNVAMSLRNRLETYDLQAQKRQLATANIKYVVLNHRPMGIPLSWFPSDGLQDEYSSVYSVVYDGPDLTVLRVY
jgi:hypothetical protein